MTIPKGLKYRFSCIDVRDSDIIQKKNMDFTKDSSLLVWVLNSQKKNHNTDYLSI